MSEGEGQQPPQEAVQQLREKARGKELPEAAASTPPKNKDVISTIDILGDKSLTSNEKLKTLAGEEKDTDRQLPDAWVKDNVDKYLQLEQKRRDADPAEQNAITIQMEELQYNPKLAELNGQQTMLENRLTSIREQM